MPSKTQITDRQATAQPYSARPTIAEFVAWQAIGWSSTTLVLTTLLFWVGIPIGPYHLWAALLLFLVLGSRMAHDWRAWLIASLWLAGCTLLGGAALGWVYDFSGDGQWYHLPATLALAQGWNPFRATQLAHWNPDLEGAINTAAVYVQHYAKGAWIVSAAAYKATGLLEATKVFNLLYMLAAFLLTASFLIRLGLSRIWAHALALTVAANPVTLYQMTSFFVDGQLGSLCTLLVVLSLDYFSRPRSQPLILLAASLVLLVNVKFTGLVYAVCLGGSLAVVAWLSGRRSESGRYAAMGLASVLVAVVLVGYQPYVTNLLTKGNPFYPAVGRDEAANRATRGQFEIWAPREFMAMNRVEKLTRSLLAKSSGAESMPRWKVPFTIDKQELYIFFNTEPRYGGFGPLFGSILMLTLIVFPFARARMHWKVWSMGAGLATAVILVVLVNPEAWWARLSPQLWLVPVILATAMALGAPGWPKRFAALLVFLLLGNSALVAALNWGRAVEKNLAFRQQITRLQAMSTFGPLEITLHPSFRMITEYRLSALSIPYRRVDKPSCAAPFQFSYPAAAQGAACVRPRD
jgi:hypothetical protein